jgi:hypothetical protein
LTNEYFIRRIGVRVFNIKKKKNKYVSLQKFIPLLFLLLCGGIPPPFLYSDSVCDIVASVRDIVPSPSSGLVGVVAQLFFFSGDRL